MGEDRVPQGKIYNALPVVADSEVYANTRLIEPLFQFFFIIAFVFIVSDGDNVMMSLYFINLRQIL